MGRPIDSHMLKISGGLLHELHYHSIVLLIEMKTHLIICQWWCIVFLELLEDIDIFYKPIEIFPSFTSNNPGGAVVAADCAERLHHCEALPLPQHAAPESAGQPVHQDLITEASQH